MIVYLPSYCRPAPKNEDEMMIEIFAYIDRLMSVVRPRRLLYMAIDGVVITFFFNLLSFNQEVFTRALNISCNEAY